MKSLFHSFSFLIIAAFAAALPSFVWARPIETRPLETIGQYAFEAQIGVWQRNDQFGNPLSTYKTVGIPVAGRIGLTSRFDIGVTLDSYTHTLETGDNDISGSRDGMVSPEIKYVPFTNLGLLAIWHARESEISTQGMPIARGDDFEFLALARIPTAWPITFNAGYLYRNPYHSNLGVQNAPKIKVEPSNVWEARGALEIPLFAHIAGVGELAYYKMDSKSIDQTKIPDSEGEAMDALVGLNWGYKGWNIGGGAAFGLLDEQHSSFDLGRGAGDVTIHLTLAYRLQAKKAGS